MRTDRELKMCRNIEQIVATHMHAQALRRAGRPIWPHKINLQAILDSGKGQESPEQIVALAQRLGKELRSLPAKFFEFSSDEYDDDLLNAVEELEQMTVDSLKSDMAHDGDEAVDVLNGWLAEIYDACDRNRVWTRG
jgi:hypothetical protein